MRKEKRQREIKLRKNFFVTLLFIIMLWIFVVVTIFLIDPSDFGAVPLFLFLLFLAIFFTSSAMIIHTRRGFLTASAITIFLILRVLGVGNVLNLLLLAGLTITLELYFSKND